MKERALHVLRKIKPAGMWGLSIFLFLAVYCALIGGVVILEGGGTTSGGHPLVIGYALIFVAALLLVVLPDCFKNTVKPPPTLAVPVALSFAIFAIILTAWTVVGIFRLQNLGNTQLLSLWGGSIVLLFAACAIIDHTRQVKVQLFDRIDILICSGVLGLACLFRMWRLGFSPPGAVIDELIVFSETLRLQRDMGNPAYYSPFGTTETAMPWLIHWLYVSIFPFLGTFLDHFQTEKVSVAIFGGISVAGFYVFVRLEGSRLLAITTVLLLLLQGTHWITSRLIYAYAGDLAWIALTCACLAAGFKTERLTCFALAAIAAALGLVWQKTAVLIVPFALYYFVEGFAGATSMQRGKIIRFAGVWVIILAVTYIPFLVYGLKYDQFLPRHFAIVNAQANELTKLGLTRWEGFITGLLRAFEILQVHSADFLRHLIRPQQPMLDPIFSVLASIGFISCIRNVAKSRMARLNILGSLLFLTPLALSFPVDGDEGVSRRMVGSLFFFACMGAVGAQRLVERTLPTRAMVLGMILLGVLSLSTNAYYISRFYVLGDTNAWYSEFGVARAHLLRAIRSAGHRGYAIFWRAHYFFDPIEIALIDIPEAKRVESIEELRDGIKKAKTFSLVFLPWPTHATAINSPDWVESLKHVIPTYLWQPGPRDYDGMPAYLFAYVFPPE